MDGTALGRRSVPLLAWAQILASTLVESHASRFRVEDTGWHAWTLRRISMRENWAKLGKR